MPGLEVEEVHANEVFVWASPAFVAALRARGHRFLDFAAPGSSLRRVRLVTAWSSTLEACERLLADAARIAASDDHGAASEDRGAPRPDTAARL